MFAVIAFPSRCLTGHLVANVVQLVLGQQVGNDDITIEFKRTHTLRAVVSDDQSVFVRLAVAMLSCEFVTSCMSRTFRNGARPVLVKGCTSSGGCSKTSRSIGGTSLSLLPVRSHSHLRSLDSGSRTLIQPAGARIARPELLAGPVGVGCC